MTRTTNIIHSTIPAPDGFSEFLHVLVEKWREVPASALNRMFSADLLALPDNEFLGIWQCLFENNCSSDGYSIRGWYHDLYADLANRNGRWIEIGSGLGYDGTFFAQQGASVTFLDIVADNLRVVERVCRLKGIDNVSFVHLDRFETIDALPTYDCLLAVGSLIHAPFKMMSAERRSLGDHLVPGGRWLELCYPRERWEREGGLPFDEWGRKTDGERTPWVEWYDIDKLKLSLYPHRFDTILSHNFHDNDFNWFDLVKRR